MTFPFSNQAAGPGPDQEDVLVVTVINLGTACAGVPYVES
jgi:hypothetical protein